MKKSRQKKKKLPDKYWMLNLKLKSLAINLGLFYGSILFTLILLEIAVRIFLPEPISLRGIYTYHPQAGYQLRKHLDMQATSGDNTVHLVSNKYGYIGEDFPLEKPEGEFRIANFGDSYVEGIQMVDWDETFVERIGKKLNEKSDKFSNFKSINFGIGGRGTIEEYWTYKYVAHEMKPDLNILWITLANDFPDNYLPVKDYELLAENNRGNIKYYLKKSALVNFVFERLKDNLTFISVLHYLGLSNKIAYTGDVEIESDGIGFDEKVCYSTLPEMEEIQEHAYKVTEEILLDFKNLTSQNNEDFLAVIIPETLRLYPELQDKMFERYARASRDDYDFSKADEAIKMILNKSEIRYLDLTPYIERYESGELNFQNCGKIFGNHFTPCGHELVAEILSRYIVKYYLD